MTKLKLILSGGLAVALIAALLLLRWHWIGVGEERIQAKWDAQVQQLQTAAAKHEADLLKQIRTQESQLNKTNERINLDYAQREGIAVIHSDAATAANNSLQQSITSAAGHRGLPTPGQDSCTCAAAYADAAKARELLGRCSAEYTALAATTDGLANQVIGLRQYAVMCQRRE